MLSCNELGLGHLSRIMRLGRMLEETGNEFFYSGGKAYELLRKEFRNVYHCTPVAWYENSYGIITSASILNILFPIPRFNPENRGFEIKTPCAIETIRRYYDLRGNIRKIRPNLIISDGDLHALRLAQRWRIPAIYITNLIRPRYGFARALTPGERFVERYIKKCSKVIIPDNPMPYTICEYNIGDLDDIGIRDRVEFVGTFFDITPVKGSEEHIFASISGPLGTKTRLMQIIIPVLSSLNVKSIVSLGEARENNRSTKIGNCTLYSWLNPEKRQELMANCKMVIFSGGHSTCFEVIKYMKPSICIPTQPEQVGNAKKLQDLNCALIAKDKEELKHAIQEIDKEGEFFKDSLRRLNKYSNRFNGLEKTIKIIEEIGG
jgi:uncharacterized protein (TIGR00661 family)